MPSCSILAPPDNAPREWKIGDRVQKVGGDYRFEGTVVAAFTKLTGQPRYVVEDERGLLFIFNINQLREVRDDILPAAHDSGNERSKGRHSLYERFIQIGSGTRRF